MQRRFVFSILFAITITSPCIAQKKIDPFEALRIGVHTHSDSLMNIFFEAWYKASDSVRKEPTTSLQKEAEALIESLESLMIDKSIQPYIFLCPVVEIYTDANNNLLTDSLDNMYPRELFGSKTLGDCKKYRDFVDRFLNQGNMMKYNSGYYIRKLTALSCHEGGCSVMLEPAIFSIRFSENNSVAVVQSAMNESGWNITLSKTNGKWTVINRVRTWIE